MSLSALLFDLDGTLLDTNGQHARAWKRALDHLGYRVPVGRIMSEIGKRPAEVARALVGATAERRHGQELQQAQSAAYRRIVGEDGVRLFSQAEELVAACRARDLQTALVTSASPGELDDVFAQTTLSREALFDAVINGSKTPGEGGGTPHAAAEAALDALGVPPGQAALVGDTPYDMTAARRAGLVGLGVLTGAHDEEVLHAAGARVVYADAEALLTNLDDALSRAAPESKPLNALFLSDLMQHALDEAWAGLSEGEVPIGAVVTGRSGRVVGRGHNRAHATGSQVARAEMMALSDARGAIAPGAVLATTVEPSTMCLGAAMEAGIDTVIYAVPSPADGGTERVAPPAGGYFPRLIGGVRVEGSRALLRRWHDRHPDDEFVAALLGMEDARKA